MSSNRLEMKLLVRAAIQDDASAACAVVRKSITELCVADHRGDADTVAAWLANKTVDNFRAWISSTNYISFVAEWAGIITGFALLNRNGTVALLYVAPQQRFAGVSDALLSAIEASAVVLGIAELRLESSGTAVQFYERRGYLRDGETKPGFGVTRSHPFRKPLSAR